jgi:hypothetical protein
MLSKLGSLVMANEPKDEKFTEAETQKRFEAALRGARIAGAKHKVAPKKAKHRPRTKRDGK